MITMLIDAVLLMALLQALDENEVDFVTAIVISIAASIATGLISSTLGFMLGTVGIILGGIIGVFATGAVISWFLGMDVKRAMIIAVIFFVVHVGLSVLLQLVFVAPKIPLAN